MSSVRLSRVPSGGIMGISPFGFGLSGCGCMDCRCKYNVPDIYTKNQKPKKKAKKKAKKDPPPKIPDPSKFKIVMMQQVDKWTIVKVQYDEAVNYEGKKIMVYKATPAEVQDCKVLDPHFCDGKHLSPFVRFEPTEDGWKAALRFALTAF
jgi:hypothetical protein